MSNVQPVRSPPSPLRGPSGLLYAVILVGIAVAVIKPWGASPGFAAAPTPRSSPTPFPRPSLPPTSAPGGFSNTEYDPSIFGDREPAAMWALWPASYLVTFGFVVHLEDGVPVAAAPELPSAAASAAASEAASPLPGSSPGGGPTWPARYVVPEGYHLFLIGIDMPIGYRLVAETLDRVTPTGLVRLGLDKLRSPWPLHFAVLGVPADPGSGRLAVWSPGVYRLDLTFGPRIIERSIEIVVPDPPGG